MNAREVDSISLFHFHVTQISRAAGQSAIASAAYRAGEKLHSDYYGEDSDYTAKHGVLYSEILLPPHAPERLRDRETLWNEVEKAERRKDAQLAYSFDIALQNELSFEENLELARQFLQENFVAAGMIVDFAIHDPERNGTQTASRRNGKNATTPNARPKWRQQRPRSEPRTWKKAFLSPSASYPSRSRARPPYRPARERMDAMLPRMMEAAGVTEELKARDPMRWVGLMNTLKAQIEENIAIELLYS